MTLEIYQIHALTTNCLLTLSSGSLQFILSQVTSEQVQKIIGALTPSQIRVLTPEHIFSLTPAHILSLLPHLSLSQLKSVVTSITAEQIQQLTTEQILCLSPASIKILMPALSLLQIQGVVLTVSQIQHIVYPTREEPCLSAEKILTPLCDTQHTRQDFWLITGLIFVVLFVACAVRQQWMHPRLREHVCNKTEHRKTMALQPYQAGPQGQ